MFVLIVLQSFRITVTRVSYYLTYMEVNPAIYIRESINGRTANALILVPASMAFH